MKTGIESGLLSWLYGKRLKKSVEGPILEDTPTEIKVHKVIAGPYQASDDPDWNEDDGDFWWVEAMVEYRDVYEEMTISHDDFNKIYDIVKHMGKPTVEPYILNLEDKND